MKKFYASILLIICVANVSMAQDTVYFKRQTSKPSKSRGNASSEKSIIKLSPISFLAGFVPVYFEREINPTFSLQVGAGITTKNYLKDWVSKAQEGNQDIESTKWSDGTENTYTDYSDEDGYKHRKAVMGYFVAVEPRIYFNSEGLDGSFIGLSLSRANYKTNAQKIVTGPSITSNPVYTNNTFAEVENVNDLLVTYGTQSLYDHIAVEYNIGLGLRNVKGTKYAYSTNNIGDYIDGVSTLNKTKLGFNLSIKIGYHF